jgi:hypothetical protein
MSTRTSIRYALAAGLGASLAVLLLGGLLFGSTLASWTESQGRWIGIVGTIVGVTGARVGLGMSRRTASRR